MTLDWPFQSLLHCIIISVNCNFILKLLQYYNYSHANKAYVVVALHLIEKALTQITLASSSTKLNKRHGALLKFPFFFLQFGLRELY